MQKEHCTKFYGILIRFQVVMKLQSFEFSVDDDILVNVQVISSLVFSAFFFVSSIERKLKCPSNMPSLPFSILPILS